MKFRRQDYTRYKKLGKKWRHPRGRQSKVRRKKKSRLKMPNIGYRKPKKERYKINGKNPILVENMKDLNKADKNNIIILSSNIGLKKAALIGNKVKEMELDIHNPQKYKKAVYKKEKLKKQKKED